MLRNLTAAAAIATVIACAGCSATTSDSERPAPQPTAASDRGPEIAGTGYTYNAPKGWGAPSADSLAGFDPDSAAADPNDTDGFADNVNVLLSPAGKLTPEQAEESARRELTAAGAENFTVAGRVLVGGGETAHVISTMSANDIEYTVEQFMPTHAGKTYIVTFSFSKDVSADKRARVTGAVLASWSWKK